jgi:hypothetical protein
MSWPSKNPVDYLTEADRLRQGLPERSQYEGRMARGARLLEVSYRLVRSDRRLLLFPVVATVATAISVAISAAVLVPALHTDHRLTLLIVTLVATAPLTLITVACGVGTAAMVADLLEGREPSAARAWAVIRARAPQILAWSLFVWTVGAVLRVLEERLPLGGRIAAWLIGVGFALATLFAIPVLAFEGTGPRDVLRASTAMTRRQFGETLTGLTVVGAGSFVITLPGALVMGAGIGAPGVAGAVLLAAGVTWLFGVGAWLSTLDTAFRTVLYRHAHGLPIDASGLTAADLELAVRAKS